MFNPQMEMLQSKLASMGERARNEVYAYMLGMLSARRPQDFAIAFEMAERQYPEVFE